MRIAFIDSSRGDRPSANRERRRMSLFARAAAELGHEATVTAQGYRPMHADAVVCHPAVLMADPGIADGAPVAVLKNSLDCRHDTWLAGHATLVVAWVWRRADFSGEHSWNASDATERAMRGKVLQVPLLPHERVLAQLEADGLTGALLRDDLEAIRSRYRGELTGNVFFAGFPQQDRREAAARLAAAVPLEVRWTDLGKGPCLPAKDYLRLTAAASAVPNLPGDTHVCYRFAEAVMLGVPVIVRRGTIHLTPAVKDFAFPGESNAIVVEDWDDWDAIRIGIDRREEIVAEADAAWRAGWGLTAQVRMMIEQLERAA